MTPPDTNRPLTGILWMLATGLCFTAVNVIVKHVGQTVPPSQAVFIRFLTGLVFILPMIPAMRAALRVPGALRGYSGRAVVHTLGTLMWFQAMASIPMAEVTAMGYVQPVWVTLGAVLFLGERVALRRILAIAAAIIGALIVLRPGMRAIEPGHLAMLVSSPAFAASYLIAKRLAETTSAAATVGWMSVSVTLLLAPFAAWSWQPVAWSAVGWLFLTAAFATTAHYTMMLGFRAAPITVTQPVGFLQLIWSVGFGALLFSEPVDGWVIVGGTVIFGSVIFIALREAQLRRRIASGAATLPP